MTEKEKEYTSYIANHINNVVKVWSCVHHYMVGEYYFSTLLWEKIDNLIKKHDASKWGSEEFDSYRQFFFPEDGVEKDKDEFIFAWNHHQKTNPHHWEYWIMWKPEGSVPLEMPFEYVIEMLCDWSAMSVAFGGTPLSFYNMKKDQILLHLDTRRILEKWIPVFVLIVEDIRRTHEKV